MIKSCRICGESLVVTKTLKAKSPEGKEFDINFCQCGTAKTIIKEDDFEEINSAFYDNLEARIKTYYYYQFNHIYIRYSQALSELKSLTNKRKLLEVGSNIGFMASIAKNNGFEVTTCEIHDKSAEVSKLLYGFENIKDFFKADQKFDVITFNDVLEHFPEPEIAVEKAFEVLNENGLIYIQLPNIESSEFEKNLENWNYLLPPDHTYHFNLNGLSKLLCRNNFSVLSSKTFDTPETKFKYLLFSEKIKRLLYNNPFYWPKLYRNKKNKGELIQIIAKKNAKHNQ